MICEFNKLSERPYFFVDPVRGNQIGRIVLSRGRYITRMGVLDPEHCQLWAILFQITMDAPSPPVWVEFGALKPYPESPIEQPGK